MATIQSQIELIDAFSAPMMDIIYAANMGVSAMEEMQHTMNESVDPSGIQAMRNYLDQATASVTALEAQYEDVQDPIRQNTREQSRFNHEIDEAVYSAGDLKNMLAGTVGAFAGMAGVRKGFSFIQDCTEAFDTQLNSETQLISVLGNMLDSDYVAQFELETTADTTGAISDIAAIQNSVDSVSVPVSAETKALTSAFDTITEKASEIQGRGIYGDEVMIAAAAEFSTYFTDTNAITTMMDTLANYAIGMENGVSEVDTSTMVDYATNLGKIMSGAYDAMTKKGFKFSDAQKAIIEGEATREQIASVLGEEYADMSSDMQAAATITQIIDEAWAGLYENMSNTPKGKIIQLIHDFGDMEETIGGRLYPYILLFVDTIRENWPTIESVVSAITTGLEYTLGILSWLMEGAINFAQAIIDNWSWISPIIWGVVAAMIAYNAVQGIGWLTTLKDIAAKAAHAVASAAETVAILALIAAQDGLNAALAACPLTWIIVLIIALIAAFYVAVAAINKFAGTSISATGIICGGFSMMFAHVANNVFIPLWNIFASFVNFIGNAFNDPVAAIKIAFYDMCLTVIGYIQNLANAIETLLNKIPGVTVDITSGLDSFYSGLEQAQQEIKDESGWVEYIQRKDYISYESAWDAGYSFGEGIEERISNFDPSSLFGTTDIPSARDYASNYAGLDGIGSGVDDISANTGSIKDSLDITQEDLRYLRDIAERETINRFTTAEIRIDQTNHNNISGEMDLDGVVSGLTDAVNEAIEIITEGVHA